MSGMDEALPQRPRNALQYVLAGLGPLVALAAMQLPIAHYLVPGKTPADVLLREAVPWAIAGFAILWVLFGERLPLSSIGFTMPDRRSLRLALWTAAFVSAVMILQFFVILPWLGISHPAAQRNSILALPFWMRLLIVLRAAITEEIIYRGLTIERIAWIAKSKVVGLVVSVVAFSAAHLRGWGAVQLVPVAIAGVAFGLLYLVRRNLPANMLAHFITDAWGFLVG